MSTCRMARRTGLHHARTRPARATAFRGGAVRAIPSRRMQPFVSIATRVRRWLFGRDFAVWYDPRYRLPLPSIEARTGFDARRADVVAWFLVESGAVPASRVRKPARVGYDDLARVHSPELLDSLDRPETLAHIFSVDPADVRPAEVMTSVRLACGATLQAARSCLRRGPHKVA